MNSRVARKIRNSPQVNYNNSPYNNTFVKFKNSIPIQLLKDIIFGPLLLCIQNNIVFSLKVSNEKKRKEAQQVKVLNEPFISEPLPLLFRVAIISIEF